MREKIWGGRSERQEDKGEDRRQDKRACERSRGRGREKRWESDVVQTTDTKVERKPLKQAQANKAKTDIAGCRRQTSDCDMMHDMYNYVFVDGYCLNMFCSINSSTYIIEWVDMTVGS